jgi:hypothetical protein
VIDVLLVGKRGDDEIYRRLKRNFAIPQNSLLSP